MNEYKPRVTDKLLDFKLHSKGAVVIDGPKWCGKTTSAKQFAKSSIAFGDTLDAEQNIFDRYDLLVSPITICLPVPNAEDRNTLGPRSVQGRSVEPLIGFCETFFQNFTGSPAASVPAGLSRDGLPVGMQVVGRKHRDGDVLAAARAFEEIQPWREQYSIPLSRPIPSSGG